MSVAIVTGSGGLVGSETVRHLVQQGYRVIGIDNDGRGDYFGLAASTKPVSHTLEKTYDEFCWVVGDIREADSAMNLFAKHHGQIDVVVHAAAQPSHDWAASDPQTDFGVNAQGTLNLLEATRAHAPDAPFVHLSTNKVYGDLPNLLPLDVLERRFELHPTHPWHLGINETMSIDRSTHSLFGVSKTAADLLVQEYGRYFGMPTVCFRCGCLTGPQHVGAELHGFLAYLAACVKAGMPYTVFGYGGKQVRDNLHVADLVAAFDQFIKAPKPAAVYNMGGGRYANCSVLEAIGLCALITGKPVDWMLEDTARVGDHRWWVSDTSAFKDDFPAWSVTYTVEDILREMLNDERPGMRPGASALKPAI